MRFLVMVCVIFILGTPLSDAFAFEGGESCASVYAGSVANISEKIRTWVQDDFLWNKHCEKDGDFHESSSSSGLSVSIGDILGGGFSGSNSDAVKKIRDFCKAHLQTRHELSDSYDYDKTIVQGALKSFNECRALELRQVHVSHTVQYPRSVNIRVDFDPTATNVSFRQMVYDSNVATCTSTGLSKDGSPVKLTAATKEMQVKPFSVDCVRIGSKTKDGGVKFDRFVAALDTSAGTYSVSLPTEEMLGYDLASENKTERNILEYERSELRKQVDGLKRQLASVKAPIHFFSHGQDDVVPCEGSPDAYAAKLCGKDKPVLQMLWDHAGNKCGHRIFAVACIGYEYNPEQR
jgi:hypothetical protein